MKNEITKMLEKYIYNKTTEKLGVFGCFEVTIGEYGRVDYLTYDTKGIWRCYEVKSCVADFKSESKHTFIGNYNYYVMNSDLFEKVKELIPDHVGVMTPSGIKKKAKKRELGIPEIDIFPFFVRSLYREADKIHKISDPDLLNSLKRKNEHLTREVNFLSNQMNKYKYRLRKYLNLSIKEFIDFNNKVENIDNEKNQK